jgi:hypothetical protein
MRLHERRIDRIRRAKPMLERVARPEILELRLNHRSEVAGRMMTKLDDAAGIAFEDDHHSAPDLCCGKCHG